MSNKVTKKTNKTQNLEQEVIEMEKEYEAIKEAREKGNIDVLTNFRIKNLKSTKLSAKIPKKLSEKEKEKRDEIRRLKEAEDLAQIQQKLFKQVKGRKKIEPLYNKKSLYSNADVFAANIEKECEKVFPKEEKSKKIEIHTSEAVIAKNSGSRTNNNNLSNMSNSNLEKVNISDRKNLSKKYKINMESTMELDDEVKDKEYLNKLDKDIKKFYLDKCGPIFNFLKDIYIVRFIDEFLKEGYDIFEEFIEIPDDFFMQKSKPFLNKFQQQKFYNKLHSMRNKYKPQNPLQNFRINQYENKINISNGNVKEDLLNQNENKIINSYINSRTNTNPNRLNDNISLKHSLNSLEHLKQKTNTTANTNTNLNTKKEDIINDNNNNNKNIIKDTSAKINKEDLMYKTHTDIDELEKKRTEEFKKAVEEWRQGKSSRPNTAYKMTSEMGTHINAQVPERTKKLLYCWNCYKQFFEGEGVSKEYTNNFELNTKYNMKNFCCAKCIKEYERKQRSQYICFQCGKMFDLVGGFIAYEGEKFCTGTCKNNYIQEAKENLKNYKKEDKKKKENKEKVQKKEKINENEDDEVDNYDPMDDF